MRITGLISIFILTAVVLYGADAHKDIAPPIDTAIPSGTVRNVSMEKVLLITNGPTGTNAVPVKNTARVAAAAQTNDPQRAGAKVQRQRRTRGGNGRRFIDVDGDGVSDDHDL